MKAVIFDFDGTLTPLTLNFDLLWKEIVKHALKYVSHEEIRFYENHFLLEMIYELARDIGGEKGDAFEHEALIHLEKLELAASREKDLFPYTLEVLSELKHKGLKLGIITRTSLAVVRQVFPNVHSFAQSIVTREDIREV